MRDLTSPFPWRSFWFAIALGVALRVAWIAVMKAEPLSDFRFYYMSAADIASGLGYLRNGLPTAFFPVGYPGFLGLVFRVVGPSVLAGQIANIILGAATIAAVFVMAWRLGEIRVALVASILVAVYPELVVYTGIIASENLAMPALCWALCLLQLCMDADSRARTLMAIGSGLCLGVLILARSTAVALPLVLALGMLVIKPRRAAALVGCLLLVSSALLPGLWMIRNNRVLGSPVLSTNTGLNLWMGANDRAAGTVTPPPRGGGPETGLSEVQRDDAYRRRAISWIRINPWGWVALARPKLAHLFGPADGLSWSTATRLSNGKSQRRSLSGAEDNLARTFQRLGLDSPLFARALWVLGVAGLALALRRRIVGFVPIALTLTYWLLLHLLPGFGQARYLLTVAPVVAIPAAFVSVYAFSQLARMHLGKDIERDLSRRISKPLGWIRGKF